MDGYDVCQRIRQVPRAELFPVIFLADRIARSDKLFGLDSGAVDYTTKPSDLEELSIRVRNSVERYRKSAPFNSIATLPEGPAVINLLEEMLTRPDWALILVSLEGIDAFRDVYGFVSADDVTRAMGLMLKNVIAEGHDKNAFQGQIGPAKFVVVTHLGQSYQLATDCQAKIESAIPYFYPAHEINPLAPSQTDTILALDVLQISSSDVSVTDIKTVEDFILAHN